jgi:large subunit ribosomal protein L25
MSAIKTLNATAREKVGKGAARAVRRGAQVPAVIYGGGQPPITIALDFNETKRLIYAGHFLTTTFEISVGNEKIRTLPRDYQLDPVRDFPLHVDFLRLSANSVVRVEVPVHVVGQDKSPGLKAGGTLQIVEHSVELSVPADAIPDSIEVSVVTLDLGETIHLSDVTLPKGTKPTTKGDVTLVTIVAPDSEEDGASPSAAA